MLSPKSKQAESDEEVNSEVTYVITRTGRKEPLDPNKITKRLQSLINRQPKIPHVNPYDLMLEVSKGLKSGVSTYEIDEYAANASASLGITNPYYLKIAARIAIDNHQKNTQRSFLDKMRKLYLNYDKNNKLHQLIAEDYFKYVEEHQDFIEATIDYNRDFYLDFFGFQTFRRSYSMKIGGKPIERPQDMFMRTAIDLHMGTCGDIEEELNNIKETYNLLSNKLYTHASPTYYNAGSLNRQYASCFLLGTEDSLNGIMKTAKDIADMSKRAGGIGVHINNLRSTGALIRGTNGESSGIVPWLKIYNEVLKGFNQGGRRPGSAAFYIMPHHPDIMKFIEICRNGGPDEQRARDIFTALWIPDIFMERVAEGSMWSTFDPDACGDLSDLTGDEYRAKYLELEAAQKYSFQLPARQIWEAALETNKDVGRLYICFADTANRLSMHKNLGIIKSSNLCVAPDTLILTEAGYSDIKTLSETNNGQHVIWNGFEYSKAQFAKTGVNKKLLRVTFSDGVELKCTPEHKFAIRDPGDKLEYIEKTTAELQVNDQVADYCLTLMKYGDADYVYDENIVPISKSAETRMAWLRTRFENNQPLKREQLMQVKLLCNTLGFNPAIDYASGKLLFNGANPVIMLYGLRKNNACVTVVDDLDFARVASIEPVEEPSDTYCFNEPSAHMGIFNGVLAMNCSEIYLYSNSNEYAVCILSSIALPNFVFDGYSTEELAQPEETRRPLNHEFPVNPYFDFTKLLKVTEQVTYNLNMIVNKTCHPLEETRRGSDRHRPIGIGVQGLDDCYAKMRHPFASEEARVLNKKIFETIYYAALSESTLMARKEYLTIKRKCKEQGSVVLSTHAADHYDLVQVEYTNPDDIPKTVAAYPSMLWNGGSPIAHGVFHWELAGLTKNDLSGMFDWETLREHIKTYGVKNSLTVACMPTASTSQLLGNNECIEPYTSNIYKRSTLAGEYIVVKKYLMEDLYRLGIWNSSIKDYLLASGGSIQYIDGIPDELKRLYPTVWEIDQEELIQQSIDRQPFVDQGQSLNLYVEKLKTSTWKKLMFKAWKGGLKTGKYYLHSKPAVTPQKFTIDPAKQEEMRKLLEKNKHGTAFLEPLHEICELCSA